MTTFLSLFDAYDFAVRQGMILVIVGLSIYVLLRAGLFAVPQVGFMAVGGYTSALLSLHQKLAFPLALLAGAAAAGLVGLAVGGLLARLNGIYLAVATIGFSEVVREMIINLDFTGGPQGLFGIPRAANDIYIVGVLVIALLFLGRLARSRFGLAMAGIREEPLMTRHQGVDIRKYRLLLFGLSGILAGLGGALYVHQSGFIDPSTYSFDLLVQVLATVVLGGMTSVAGPLLGAIVVFGLPQVLGGFEEFRNVANGALIVLVVAVMPAGIAGGFDSLWGRLPEGTRSWRPKLTRRTASPVASTSGGRSGSEAPVPRDRLETQAEPLLKLDNIEKRFGGIRALQGVSMEVRRGEIFGIIGPNGSGKTSLLNVLSGVYDPEAGEGFLNGHALAGSWGRPEKLAAFGIARTFQGIRLLGTHSVLDNVLLGCYRKPSVDGARPARDRAMDTLDELGLAFMATKPAASLSYGLQRKVEIARALVSAPQLLLLDEPTAGMNPQERSVIFELVQSVRNQGVTVVVVEHDVSVMTEHCDRIAVLNFGKSIAVGRPAEVLKQEEVIDAYIGRPA